MKNFLHINKNSFYSILFLAFVLALILTPKDEVCAAASCVPGGQATVTTNESTTQVFGNPIVCQQFCFGSCSGTNGTCTYTKIVDQNYSSCSAYCSAGYVPQQSNLGYCVPDSNGAISCLGAAQISDQPIGGGWCQVTNSCTGVHLQTALYQIAGSCQANTCVCTQNQINDVSSGLCEYNVNGATTMTQPPYWCGAVDLISISLSPPLRTISSGQATSYTVTVSSTYVGTLNLSVSGCPGNGASCTLTRNSIVFAAGSADDNPASFILNITNTANVSPNNYTLRVSGSGAGVASGSAQLQVNSVTPANLAECVSITAPSPVVAGSTFPVTVVMKNIGTRTWLPTPGTTQGSIRHALGPVTAHTVWTNTFFLPGGRLLLPAGTSVAPRASYAFTATMTAPVALGNYPFKFEMVEDRVEWFLNICTKPGGITVVAPPPLPVPVMHTPSCNATGNQVTLSWDTVTGVDTFQNRLDNWRNNAPLCLYGWLCDPATEYAEPLPRSTLSKTYNILPNTEYNWWLHANDVYGTWGNASAVTFTCASAPTPATADIKANGSDGPVTIPYNGTADVTWTSANATSCSVGGWTGTSASAGTHVVNLTSTTIYTLSCLPAGANSVDTITVNVQPQNKDLTVIKSGQGTVTSVSVPNQASQINCAAGCASQSVVFPPTATVTLTAVPATGRKFTGWTIQGGGSCSGTGTCTVTTDVDKTVIVNFVLDPNYKEF